MVKDMTAGSPAKLIVRFALPLMLGHKFAEFFDHRLLSGSMRRLCHSGGTALRRERNGRIAPFCRQYRLACGGLFGAAGGFDRGALQAHAAGNEHAAGYY